MKNYRFISADMIVAIATITMLIDHTGAVFFKQAEILRVIGRIAFILYADMAAIAVLKTSNLKKYVIRLVLFSILSQVPYCLAFHNCVFTLKHLNIGVTILAGVLLNAWLYKAICMEFSWKKAALMIIWLGAAGVMLKFSDGWGINYGDYGIVVMILMFLYEYARSLDNPWATAAGSVIMPLVLFTASSVLVSGPTHYGLEAQCWSFLALPFIFFRSDEKKKRRHNIGYWFYPVHLLLFALIKIVFFA